MRPAAVWLADVSGQARPLPVHYYQEYYHYGQTQ